MRVRISEITKLQSFVSAVKARGHMKLNNGKISSITYPEFVRYPHYIKKEKKITE